MRVDSDGEENNFVCPALNVKHVKQVFHADIVSSERGWVITREAWRSAADRADRTAVGRRINKDDAVGVLQRLQQREAAGATIQALHTCRQCVLFQFSYNINANAFIAHEDVAQAKHQRLYRFICHSSPGQTSIHL